MAAMLSSHMEVRFSECQSYSQHICYLTLALAVTMPSYHMEVRFSGVGVIHDISVV
jgi:hypothetical protein